MFACLAHRQSLGYVLLMVLICGLIDTIITAHHGDGWETVIKVHGIGTVGVAGVGAWLLLD